MSVQAANQDFWRDCGTDVPEQARRCPSCRSPRVARHPELGALSIAHLDCDAFYAAVEKRDNPELKDKPV
ncbi:MAG: DNA polymerase IV, partial [Aestuariivirgaceae bacterium]|nr:DNA polymerase IV [Aestuariivirgaceae bacterium]